MDPNNPATTREDALVARELLVAWGGVRGTMAAVQC
jgi:hypothetical protein